MAIRNRQTASLWLCFGITGDFLGRGSIAFVIKSARPAQTVAANGDLSRLMNGNFFFSIFAGCYHLSLRCLSPTSPLGPLYITTLSRYMNPIRHCALAVVQTHTKREEKIQSDSSSIQRAYGAGPSYTCEQEHMMESCASGFIWFFPRA